MTTDNDIYINKATGKEYKLVEHNMEGSIGFNPIKFTYHKLEPIDDNPMPDILPGDYLVSGYSHKYITSRDNLQKLDLAYIDEHWRHGVCIWERKP